MGFFTHPKTIGFFSNSSGGKMNTEDRSVIIEVCLDENEAIAYAQFLKRVRLVDYQMRAASDDEAHTMMSAGGKIRSVLLNHGFAPR
jgi:hypothetical protein